MPSLRDMLSCLTRYTKPQCLTASYPHLIHVWQLMRTAENLIASADSAAIKLTFGMGAILRSQMATIKPRAD